MSLMRRVCGLLIVVVACAPGAARAEASGAPPLQALKVVDTIELQLPAGVTLADDNNGSGVDGVELTPDQEHLYFLAEVDGRKQIAIVNLDGTGYRCLSCGVLDRPAAKPTALSDERRIWFAYNPGGGLGEQQWAVLECAPSIYDCAEAEVLQVEFPIDSIATGAQNREAKPDRTGHLVAWNEVRLSEGTRVSVAKLKRRADDYVLTDQRVVNPTYTLGNGPAGWVDGGRFYEGGEWVDGGRMLKYQTTGSALNYDTWLLDLKTGERKPLTTDLDYNETANYSPSSEWVLHSSARGLDRMDVFSQLERPSFIDMVSFGQIGRISLFNNRRCMNERWIMSREHGQRRGGYGGQPLTLRTDYNIRRLDWFDEGNRFIVTETRLPNREAPTDPEDRFRIAIVELPGERAHDAPPEINPERLPYEKWTVPADEYVGLSSRPQVARVVHGEDSGTATMTFVGNFAGGSWTVAFDDYSDDGRSFVDGTESVSYPNAITTSTYLADLTVRGEHKGEMTANVQVHYPSGFNGTAESTVDGNQLSGIPTQDTCPGIAKPGLELGATDEHRLDNGWRELRVRVRAQVPEDAKQRPVEHAGIRLKAADGRRIRSYTDERGRTRITIPPDFPRRYDLVAVAGGFARDSIGTEG